jgi:hypothetical protein
LLNFVYVYKVIKGTQFLSLDSSLDSMGMQQIPVFSIIYTNYPSQMFHLLSLTGPDPGVLYIFYSSNHTMKGIMSDNQLTFMLGAQVRNNPYIAMLILQMICFHARSDNVYCAGS